MADISQVTLSNGNVVNIKDSAGREALATGLAGKVSIAQGVQNQGKILKVASSGILELIGDDSVTSIKMNNGTPIEPDSDGVVDLGTVITAHQDISSKLDTSEKGANNGVATLDASGKVPSSQLPSYVDDVLEYASLSDFPLTGETGKIYVAIDTGKVYRWSGSAYVNIASISVVDNLTSTSATDALSAKQGKTLNDSKADKTDTVLMTTLSRGRKENTTSGDGSIALGSDVTASGNYSQAFGSSTTASGNYSHAEGRNTTASVIDAHAEGYGTLASGAGSHAEGGNTSASGIYSHAEGYGTLASGAGSHVSGYYNVSDNEHESCYSLWSSTESYAAGAKVYTMSGTTAKYYISKEANTNKAPLSNTSIWQDVTARNKFAEIVGNGLTSSKRFNARALDWSGNEYLGGDLYVGCDGSSNNGTKVAKTTDIPSVVDNLTSTSATDALSAKQGKALNDKIDAIETYSEISDTNIASGTGSSAGLVSGRRVKYAIQQNLKVTNGDVQLYGEHLTGQVPAPTTTNNGKILKIASGAYTLANETTELPTVSSSDNTKVLTVVSGAWAAAAAPSGLPSVTSTDNGKFLRVVSGAWAAATVDSANGVSF